MEKEMDNIKDGLNVGELVRFIFKHIALVILPAIAGGLCMFILATNFITPRYVSDIKLGVYTKPSEQINPAGNLQADTYLVQDYAVIIQSRKVAETVIKELQLLKDGQPQDLDEFLENNLVVNPGDGTSRIITVSVVYDDPFTVADIAAKYSEVSLRVIHDLYEADNIQVVDEAKVPLKKYSPSTMKFLVVGVGLGFFAGIGLLIILFILSKTVIKKA